MATSAFTKRISAGQVIRDVMEALGLPAPENMYESTDPTVVQMRGLLLRAGQKLMGRHEWQFLSREWVLDTVLGQSQYPLPEDLDCFVQDAAWNRTTRLPAIGSLSEQEWQMLKARQLEGTTFTMLYRVHDNNLELYDTPSTVQRLALPYSGRGWVRRTDAGVQIYADNPEQDSDIVLYDRQLIVAALRLEWDIEKKFDTSSSVQAFNECLRDAKASDTPGRTLTLNQQAAYPYLGIINIPDTGYGS